jgi:cysteine synthase A
MKIANDITQLIGNTPLLKINSLSQNANIIGKCEFLNPASSIKDRAALFMINQAIKDGKIDANTTIIEPTSGNTGIALAMICATQRRKLILTMPESMSQERIKLLRYLGAKVILTDASGGMNAAIAKANELAKSIPNSVILGQFDHPNNPLAHEKTTAIEILNDMDNDIDVFVTSVGTGGTLSGIAKVLKQKIPHIYIVALEPCQSAILSGKSPNPHKIQGIGAGFVPKTLDVSLYDEVLCIDENEAIKYAKDVAKSDGLLVGISSGANLAGAAKLSQRDEFRGKNIVTILCDSSERYISTELFDE